LWCGGTLHLHASRRDRVDVFLFHCLSGTRMREAQNASKLLGMNVTFLPAPEYGAPSRAATLNAIGSDPPDVVVTHWMDDTHLEHLRTFEHALEIVHHIKRHVKREPLLLMTSSYFANGSRGAFEPNVICDISTVIDTKRAAIETHTSQRAHLLLYDVLSQNRLWGARISTDYAEGFLEYPLFGKHLTARRANFHDLILPR